MLYNDTYKTILDEAEKYRKAIIENNIDNLSFGGTISKDDSTRIKLAVEIENLIFTYLMLQEGLTYEGIPGKPNLVKFEFEGNTYFGQKDILNKNLKAKYPKEREVKQDSSKETSVEKEKIEDEAEEKVEEKEVVTNKPVKEEPEINNDEEIKKNEIAIEPDEKDTYEDDDLSDMEFEDGNNSDIEPKIASKDIIYERISFTLRHTTEYNTPEEEYELMCAPLVLSRIEKVSVPIIVSIIKKGGSNRVTNSSYDSYNNGQNLVTVDIDDYSLLVRGYFDSNGIFHTYIGTTSKSIAQGDVITLKDQKAYGRKKSSTTKNGHPVLDYESGEGKSNLMVFPLEDIGVENFIIMTKTEEFVNYMLSSCDTRGAYRATIEDNNIKKTVLPHWTNDNEILEVELLEG